MEGPEPGCDRSGLEALRAHAGKAREARQPAPGRRQGRRAERAAGAHAARRQIRAAAAAARIAHATQVRRQTTTPARAITSIEGPAAWRKPCTRSQQEEALKPRACVATFLGARHGAPASTGDE